MPRLTYALTTALALGSFAPAPASAFDTFGCYAETHDQCFNVDEKWKQCSDEVYRWFLAWCDNPGIESPRMSKFRASADEPGISPRKVAQIMRHLKREFVHK